MIAMETTYNREDLQVHLELIKPAGFTLESFDDEFYYTKQEVERKIILSDFFLRNELMLNKILLPTKYCGKKQVKMY